MSRLFVNARVRFAVVFALISSQAGISICAGADTTLFVDANARLGGDGLSWGAAHRYLQDALYGAADLNESEQVDILIAQGTYLPDHDEAGAQTLGDRDASFHLLNNVALLGGYAGGAAPDPWHRDIINQPTVLSGDLNQDDQLYFINVDENSYHVTTARGTDSSAVLDGVTVRSGNTFGLDGGELQAYFENGAAVFCWDGSPTLRDCTFRLCRAVRGGAVYANGETWYDGVLQYVPIAPTIIGCTFTQNYSVWYGGAVALNVSGLTMADTTFIWNETTGVLGGGGLSLRDQSIDGVGATIHNSRFVGNFATGGGIGGALRISYVPTRIANTTFLDNTAEGDGGALYISPLAYTIDLDNCTIAGNRSVGGNGGGIRVTGFNLTIRNSILWGNTHGGPIPPEECAQLCGPFETVCMWSCIEDWSGHYEGENNIAADPLFVDHDGPDNDPDTWDDNDYRLSPGSPCIDAAHNSHVSPDILDLDDDGDTAEPTPFDVDGDPRFIDDPDAPDAGCCAAPIVDMGAYERQIIVCPADINGSGTVDPADLTLLLGSWGANPGAAADLDGDGVVGAADLAILLGSWGPCPSR